MIKLKPGFHIITLGTRGFSRVRWEFLVLAEGRHSFGCRPEPRVGKRVTIKSWQKPETELEKSLAPRVPYHRYHRCDRCGRWEKKNFSDHSDHKKPLSSDQQSVRYKKFYLSDRCHCDRWAFFSQWSQRSQPGVHRDRSDHIETGLKPFLLNCYLYALQTHRTHSSELRLLLV